MRVVISKLRKLPPYIGQLQTGEYAVFNMEGTDLWDATFPSRGKAAAALLAWKVKAALEMRDEK